MMKRKLIIFSITTLGIAVCLGFLLQSITFAEPSEPEAIAGTGSSKTWESPQLISSNPGKLPAIATANDSRTVMIGYINTSSSIITDTMYFSKSTNNGAPNSWSTPSAINNTPTEQTLGVDIAYDGSNQAHALWTTSDDTNFNIYYSNGGVNESNWPVNSPFRLSQTSDLILNPALKIYNNRILAVWAEQFCNPVCETDINYRFKNGNAAWTNKAKVIDTNNLSQNPEIAVTNNGQFHVVWQEGPFPPFPTNHPHILYSQGTVTGNDVSWTLTPINISTVSGALNAVDPQITVEGNTVHVSYTDWQSANLQFVHHIKCSSNCTTVGNWQSDGPISGQSLSERTSAPYAPNVRSTITQVGDCTYVYFYGKPNTTAGTKEQIFGANDCNNWSNNGRDTVTPASLASIYPKMASQNDFLIYLTYENVASDETRKVWFIRNKPGLYLPVILK